METATGKVVETSFCPTCGSPWEIEMVISRSIICLPGHVTKDENIRKVECPNGHSFDYMQDFFGMRDPLRHAVVVPSVVRAARVHPVRAAEAACVGCLGVIQPGQLYSGSAASPRHMGC